MQVIQRLYTSQANNVSLHVLMQVTRVTIQPNCKQHNDYIIMHTDYKGYKPIVSNTIYAYVATGYKGYKPIANNTICDLTLEIDRILTFGILTNPNFKY